MLTVLLATHNGAATLPAVLDAHLRLRPPAGGHRIVVVDNASSDDTPALLARYSTQLPLASIRTERRGKNVALNIGLDHIEGDLVVLTDDDAVPAVDWLIQLRAAADQQSAFDIFSGRIDPIWPPAAPEWIQRLVPLGATFALTGSSIECGPVEASRVWGPNMAVRRSIFAAGHRFDEAIGPQAGQYVMGSEVEFTCRLERAGHRAWHIPSAAVGHIIRPHQVERDWIVKRAYRLGRHMFHQEAGALPPEAKLLRGAPRWKYKMLAAEWVKKVLATLRRDFDQRFLAEWEISFLQGYLSEAATSTRTHAS